MCIVGLRWPPRHGGPSSGNVRRGRPLNGSLCVIREQSTNRRAGARAGARCDPVHLRAPRVVTSFIQPERGRQQLAHGSVVAASLLVNV
jgi:hypothetical protein